MTTVRRISEKEIRKSVRSSDGPEAPPEGISPILRASWKFARDTAERFNRDLLKDHVKDLLKSLSKRFT